MPGVVLLRREVLSRLIVLLVDLWDRLLLNLFLWLGHVELRWP